MDSPTKWRLILGEEASEQTLEPQLNQRQQGIDKVLDALYDSGRRGGLGSSSPNVNRWLGDIRKYFPTSTVQMLQKDALERLNLHQMLLEPEMLQGVEPDVHLIGTLLSLNKVMPEQTKETARQVVRKVVQELQKKLENPLRQAVMGSLSRSVVNRRPKSKEIDWDKTIRANLKHYQKDLNTIIPEILRGFGRKGNSLKDIILCVDQSGSMASSVVYSSVFGAVLASLPAVSTRMIVFDTAVVDLTENLKDPVDLLFGTQLGGGTDINKALAYCQQFIRNPADTVFVLITDLYEGGNETEMVKRAAAIKAAGVQFVTLLALSDDGAPYFDHGIAQKFASLGIPSFACTPDQFPDLMATAIKKGDITQWAAREGIVTKG